MLVVASMFRDAAGYVDRYFTQIQRLRDQMDVRLVLAEGDSSDGTWERLSARLRPDDVLVKAEHGGPAFDSVDDPLRWAQIGFVCNKVLAELHLDDDDKLIWVESDLIWPWDTMVRLSKDLDTVSAVASMSYHGPTGLFYDIWGHVGMDGRPFSAHPPYHPTLRHAPLGVLVPILSAGSCIAVRGDVVNAGVSFSTKDGIRGFCRTIREHTVLWLDTGAEVWQP